MKILEFTKMEGSGNDFILLKPLAGLPVSQLKKIVPRLCDRKYGIGADGVLVLVRSKKADLCIRIFNADGSEPQMCGNGARCAAFYYSKKTKLKTFDKIGRAHV